MSRFTCLSLGKIAGTMALTRGLFDSSRNGCPPTQKDARYPVGERVGVHGKSKQMSLEIKTTAQLFHAKRVNFLQSRSEYHFFIFLIMFLSFVIIFASSSANIFQKWKIAIFLGFFHFFNHFFNHVSSFLLPVVQKFSKKLKIAIFLEFFFISLIIFHFFFIFIIFAPLEAKMMKHDLKK
jgi:hypothetical protein